MSEKLKLMAVLAHPDDESLGLGGTLARCADEGIETYIVTATRGERGRFGDAKERPEAKVVGEVREGELRAAADILGVNEVTFLDYIDGDLDKADPGEVIRAVVNQVRRVQPDVIVTFGPEGGYGHPDHIAISQFATAAAVCAADPAFSGSNGAQPHRVSKLYYMAWTEDKWKAYQAAFKNLVSKVDGEERVATPWQDWAITTYVDTTPYWTTVWKAIQCHETQLTIYDKLATLPEEYHKSLWGSQEFYRVFSAVNGGRKREADLFEGLR
jgi:LmbE family N-acetylglucosaminyl deacetylase